MKKLLPALLLSFVLCFSMAGCGGGTDNEKESEPELKATSIVGDWECTDLSMKEGDTTMQKDELEGLYGKKVKELAHLKAYDDGTGEFVLLDETSQITWEEADGGYVVRISGEENQDMNATLEGNSLTVSSEDSYTSDGEEIKTTMSFGFTYLGSASRFIEGWDLELSDDEVREMNNSMEYGNFIIVDNILYGTYGGETYGSGFICMAEIKAGDKPELGEIQKIKEDSWLSYLTEHEGYIYGVMNNSEIVRIKVGEKKIETVYDKECSTMQIVGDKIYFSDKNCNLCSMNLDTSNEKTIISKEVYYPYVLPNNTIIYQDDADNESLHIYEMKTGNDAKLNDVASYCPMIYGDHVYYSTKLSEDSYQFQRVDLYSGKIEKAEGDMGNSEFFIEGDRIYFGFGGIPSVGVEEWDQLSKKTYGGGLVVPRYSNGEIRIYTDDKGFLKATCDNFESRDTSVDLGYMYFRK